MEFDTADFEIQPVHVAFLVSEVEFDELYARITASQVEHWADPQRSRPGQFNTNHGGRGVYVRDPGGQGLEFLTAPHGADRT